MKTRTKIILTACCTITALTSLWLGSYLLHLYPISHWASFPIFVTAVLSGVISAVLTAQIWTDSP